MSNHRIITQSDNVQAEYMKKQGLVAGMPDLMIAIPNKIYHGLFIELKAINGKAAANQKSIATHLNNKNYLALICYGWLEAKAQIEKYMKNIIPLSAVAI